MTRRRIVLAAALTASLVLVAGAAAAWWVFLRDDTPAKAKAVHSSEARNFMGFLGDGRSGRVHVRGSLHVPVRPGH